MGMNGLDSMGIALQHLRALPLAAVAMGCTLFCGARAAESLTTPDAPGKEVCHSIEELMAEGQDPLKSVPSDISERGHLWRWSVETGSVLELKLRTARAGNYEISIRALQEGGEPVLSGSLWEMPLRHRGDERFGVGEEGVAATLTMDPVALGPGHHTVELLGVEAGGILLDCVSVRRTGDWTPPSPRSQPAPSNDRAFLGVQLDSPRDAGVAIDRVYPGTAAAEHGLQSGDVILEIDGVSTTSLARLQDTIGSHKPGDSVEVDLLRDGERKSLQVKLGDRPGDSELRSEEAKDVLAVLKVQPGQTVADLGCGSGWLSEAMAGRVGGNGRVYAVEIQEQHIARLYARSLPGVVPVLSLPDDVSLPENSLDLAVLHDVASHIDREARPSFYDSVRRALKPGAQLAVFGPHGEAEEMLRVLRSNGFVPLQDDILRALSSAELDRRLAEGILLRPR
jgi:SAM-dependent methyltransferase